MISIFNEYKYAEDILKNGFITEKKGLELFILAKYFRFAKDKDCFECKELLKDFCKTQIENYDNTDFYKKVNTALYEAYQKNAKLLHIEYIEFSEFELNYIQCIGRDLSGEAKKVLFCLWCLSKLQIEAEQNNLWVATNPNEFKRFCGLKSKQQTLKIINELYNHNLVFVSDKWALDLIFIKDFDDAIQPNTIFHTYRVYDFDTCDLWWEQYIGNKKVANCGRCGKLFIKNNNKQRYCKDCARLNELEKYDRYNQKR